MHFTENLKSEIIMHEISFRFKSIFSLLFTLFYLFIIIYLNRSIKSLEFMLNKIFRFPFYAMS